METTVVIMTEGTSPYGNYVTFRLKGSGVEVGKIVCINKKWGIYIDDRYADERSSKALALSYLQRALRKLIPSDELKFRWNVMMERIRFA